MQRSKGINPVCDGDLHHLINESRIVLFCSWKFACTVILNEEVRPRLAYYKWENIKMNLDQCREYHALYFKNLRHLATQKEKQRVQVR